MFIKVYHRQVGISLLPSMLQPTGQGASTSSSYGQSRQTAYPINTPSMFAAYPCGMHYPWMPLLQPLWKYFNQQQRQWSEHFRHVTPVFSPAPHVFICTCINCIHGIPYSTMLIDESHTAFTVIWLLLSSILLKNWSSTGIFNSIQFLYCTTNWVYIWYGKKQ